MTTLEEKRRRYEKHRQQRRRVLRVADVGQIISHFARHIRSIEREGQGQDAVWVTSARRPDGSVVTIRNTDRLQAMLDLATVHGYDVIVEGDGDG